MTQQCRVFFVVLGCLAASVASAAANMAPSITGDPDTQVAPGEVFYFKPVAWDPDGTSFRFRIENKPSWASFNTYTGELTGRPSVSGVYRDIVISATDGKLARELPAFSIVVAEHTTKMASLSWLPPSTNTDGSTLLNLGGYRIYHGTGGGALPRQITVGPGMTSYTFDDLPRGTHYFSITSFTVQGVESARSPAVKKAIR